MRKVIYDCVNNIIIYALTGPLLIIVALGTIKMAGIAVLIYTIFAVLYYFARFVFLKKSKSSLANYFRCNEIARDDEREIQITGKALKMSYYFTIYSMIIIMLILQFFAVFTSQASTIFVAAILLITLALIIITSAYCIRWVVEYKK